MGGAFGEMGSGGREEDRRKTRGEKIFKPAKQLESGCIVGVDQSILEVPHHTRAFSSPSTHRPQPSEPGGVGGGRGPASDFRLAQN